MSLKGTHEIEKEVRAVEKMGERLAAEGIQPWEKETLGPHGVERTPSYRAYARACVLCEEERKRSDGSEAVNVNLRVDAASGKKDAQRWKTAAMALVLVSVALITALCFNMKRMDNLRIVYERSIADLEQRLDAATKAPEKDGGFDLDAYIAEKDAARVKWQQEVDNGTTSLSFDEWWGQNNGK